jgi:hypothetical protein
VWWPQREQTASRPRAESHRPADSDLHRRPPSINRSKQDQNNRLNYLAAYGSTAVVMLVLGVVWLGLIAKSF